MTQLIANGGRPEASRRGFLRSAAAFAASICAAEALTALPTDSSQAAVPSRPTGAEPTTGRPAVRNSRVAAV